MNQAPCHARIVYASFDRFPSPKGAATHIDAFVTALGHRFQHVDLLTIVSEEAELADLKSTRVPPDSLTERGGRDANFPEIGWRADGVTHHPFYVPGANVFERVLSYRSQIWKWWQQRFHENRLERPIVHFRSIFEGYPIARHKQKFCRKLVFEVNGLPSIEMKYRYPNVADDAELLRKLFLQEQVCLEAADLIVTVSQVNAEYLARRGVPENLICVIPNGVDTDVFSYRDPSVPLSSASATADPTRILYSGTMSAWQGVSLAMEALALYRRDFPATLTLVGPARPRQRRDLFQRAFELGVSESVRLLDPVSKPELATLHHEAEVIVAPLTSNDRNLIQGCCPLKVLEAMASGTPIIASDLPVVRELVTGDVEALLVRPGSGKAIKDGILKLRFDECLANRISRAARKRVEREFTWSRAQAALVDAYERWLDFPVESASKGPSTSPNRAASRSS